MDNFWFSDAAPTLERKHEGITSRPRESWAREILGWSGYHRVESRMSGEIFEGRKDEFADSTKSARPNERGPRNHVELLFRCRVECKSVRVYPKYRTAQISRAAPVFFLHPPPLSLSLLPLLSIRWLSAKNTFTLLLNSKFHPTILFHKGIMEIQWKLLKNILEKFNDLMREIFLLKDIMPLNENKIHHQTES